MKLTGARLAGKTNLRQREENDFYATPRETTLSILNEIELYESILEPCCGLGNISEVLKEYYPGREIVSTDLIDRGYGEGNIDFLTHNYNRKFNNIITNPPFNIIKPFLYKCLEVTTDQVILFCKIQFLESISRRQMFKETPLKYVYVFSERQNILKGIRDKDENGKKWSGTICFAWYVWEHGYEGEPVLRWI